MLKANISLYAEKRGQDSCQPLLDAGTNWYDAKAEIDFLLEEENRFSLRITPLNGGEIRDVEIALTGLPKQEYCYRRCLNQDVLVQGKPRV